MLSFLSFTISKRNSSWIPKLTPSKPLIKSCRSFMDGWFARKTILKILTTSIWLLSFLANNNAATFTSYFSFNTWAKKSANAEKKDRLKGRTRISFQWQSTSMRSSNCSKTIKVTRFIKGKWLKRWVICGTYGKKAAQNMVTKPSTSIRKLTFWTIPLKFWFSIFPGLTLLPQKYFSF